MVGNSSRMECPPAYLAILLPGMVLLKGLSATEGRHIVTELNNLLLRATFEAHFPKRNLLTRDSHLCLRSAQELFLTTARPKLMRCWKINQFLCPDLFLHPCRNGLMLFWLGVCKDLSSCQDIVPVATFLCPVLILRPSSL